MEKQRDIENALLDYWKRVPDAADTLDAIAAEWLWMAPRKRVATALARLQELGAVRTLPITTGDAVFLRARK